MIIERSPIDLQNFLNELCDFNSMPCPLADCDNAIAAIPHKHSDAILLSPIVRKKRAMSKNRSGENSTLSLIEVFH